MTDILFVDDEFDIAQAVKGILEDEGYSVEACPDSRRALECLQEVSVLKGPPRLVFIDAVMPYMSGVELLKQLKSDKRLAGSHFVLMNNAEPGGDCGSYQWDAFLRKPFNLKTLMELVQRFTTKH